MSEILKVDAQQPQPQAIARAVELLSRGEVVGIPTDTVYGLASDAYNALAAEKVFALKRRRSSAPLLLLVNSVEMALSCMSRTPELFHRLATKFWPGPLTIVVPAAGRIPEQITAGSTTIGLRLPRSAIAAALIDALGRPITASSANRSGEPECRTARAVEAVFGGELPLILDGGTSSSDLPSTVVSLVHGSLKLLREGVIAEKTISDFLLLSGMSPSSSEKIN